MNSAATYGNGGAKDTGIAKGELKVKYHSHENWQILVQLRGIVGARRSANCVQHFQEALALIAAFMCMRILSPQGMHEQCSRALSSNSMWGCCEQDVNNSMCML